MHRKIEKIVESSYIFHIQFSLSLASYISMLELQLMDQYGYITIN